MDPITPPPDREAIHLRRVEGGRSLSYPGRLESCPDQEGFLEASFALATAPAVRVGQHVELCYLQPGEAQPRAFLAKVVLRRLGSSAILYRFLARSGARDGRPLTLSRREAERAQVDDDTAWSLRLGLEGTDAQPLAGATLLDISVTGAQALVPLELEALLYASDRLRVQFRLLGAPCEVLALVRRRALDEGDVRYGLQFVEESPGFARVRELIAGYVVTRPAAAETDADAA